MNPLRLVAAAAAVVGLAACVPPPPASSTLPRRAPDVTRWERWVERNVHRVEIDLSSYGPGTVGGYRADLDIVAIDPAALHAFVGDDRRAERFIRTHEDAHVADYKALGFLYGPTPVGVERAAQCIAEAVLGYSFTSPRLAQDAYWDCGDAEVRRTTQALMKAGLL